MNNSASNNNGVGILLYSSSYYNTLVNNTANLNEGGIFVEDSSSNNKLTKNTANMNTHWGITVATRSNSTILINNTASNNGDYGIYLFESFNNTLTHNTMSQNNPNFGVNGDSFFHYIHSIDTSNKVDGKPIYYWIGQKDQQVPNDAGYVGIVNSTNITVRDLTLTNNSAGVLLVYSSNSTIENVNASNNIYGIWLIESKSNILTNSTISKNYCGVRLESSTSNSIYHNNLINNTDQAYDNTGTNSWDNGYPSGGNYWSDYDEESEGAIDEKSGPNQDEDGSDGIVDTPYNIPGNAGAQDRYPFMNENGWLYPYTKIDVGVTSNIILANPSDLAPYLPPEYAGMDMGDAVVLNVSVTDNTPDNLTDDAYTDITIKTGELDIETCKVFKTGIGFLSEVDDVTTLPTVSGDPAFSRDLVNNTVTVRLYVGDPLLGVIPPAAPSVFDTVAPSNPLTPSKMSPFSKPL